MLMREAIEAFNIYMKYNPGAQTEGEHDVLFAWNIEEHDITDNADVIRLGELGWFWSDEYDRWSCFI